MDFDIQTYIDEDPTSCAQGQSNAANARFAARVSHEHSLMRAAKGALVETILYEYVDDGPRQAVLTLKHTA